MLSNNVVSFMKKIVKNADTRAHQPDNSSSNKLSRLKQTLATGLQQAHESVVKFSPIGINVGGEVSGRRTNNKEPFGEDAAAGSSDSAVLHGLNGVANPALLGTDGGGSKDATCKGPPNRLTTCRVCVRTLSANNSDVSYRLCSQCNLKVCEDCASYSNLDSDIDQTFWRCSVCRRRGTTPTPTAVSSVAGTPQQSKAPPVTPTAMLTQRLSEDLIAPSSAPVVRRRGTTGETHPAMADLRPRASLTPGGTSSNHLGTMRPNHGHSFEDVRYLNGSHAGVGSRKNSRSASRLDQQMSEQSSPDDLLDQQQHSQYNRTHGPAARKGSEGHHPMSGMTSPSSLARHLSNRRSFQQQPRDQSLYLSADDACNSRWQLQRRYSSESSDASDISCSVTPRRRSQAEMDEAEGVVIGPPPPSITRRRMSFRSSRTRHFYDGEGSDGYDADEQSVSVGTYDSASPSPIDPIVGPMVMDAGNGGGGGGSACGSRISSPRQSCANIGPMNSGGSISGDMAPMTPNSLHSPRGSIFEGDGRHSPRPRKVSTQMSDPPIPGSISRSASPRSSISGPRRSIERAAISIIIDDVDSSFCGNNVNGRQQQQQQPQQQQQQGGTGTNGSGIAIQANPTGSASVISVRLNRDSSSSRNGGGSGHGFTSGFGLTLSSPPGRHRAVITRIEPHGSAERAGLQCGDIVLCWDGVHLKGRSLDELQDELQHSGDCIQIEVERDASHAHGSSSDQQHQPAARPNKLSSALIGQEYHGGNGGSASCSTPPSPTRRRLPQAPVGIDSLVLHRVQLKIKSEASNASRTGSSYCLTISVLGAEKLPPNQSAECIGGVAAEEADSFMWITVLVTLPNGGGSRMFTTDRIAAYNGQPLRWNSVFTCPDLTIDEASRSHVSLALWEDSLQRGEGKLAETKLNLERMVLDGRSIWFPLRQCSESSHYNSPSPSPCISRRPSKNTLAGASSNAEFYSHQQQNQTAFSSRHSSALSVDHPSDSPSTSLQRTPTPPGLPRSRSAEISFLLLQPEAAGWGTTGLSAPASLAPSRRGSSFNCEEGHLPLPQSSPTSRRGSFAHAQVEPEPLTNIQLVHDRLSSTPSYHRRSNSYREDHDVDPQQQHHHQLPRTPTERTFNVSSLELGTGQILPTKMTLMARGEAEHHFAASKSIGQIKIGLIITQGQLEVEVISARNLPLVGDAGNIQPDTFVKVSLCDQDRVFSKRKTRTMRQTCHPQFHQTLMFEACNALGATLVVAVRLKDGGGIGGVSGRSIRGKSSTRSSKGSPTQQHQSTIGLVHIALDHLPLSTLTISWYRLIPPYLISASGESFFQDDSP